MEVGERLNPLGANGFAEYPDLELCGKSNLHIELCRKYAVWAPFSGRI